MLKTLFPRLPVVRKVVMRALITLTALLLAVSVLSPVALAADTAPPRVMLKTSLGDIELELEPQKSSVTVKNFLQYVNSGFYDGTIFHRVIPGFMIQGGGLQQSMQEKSSRAPIKNEANNGLSNLRGTVAMARTSDPDSASSQFFINVADNTFLDYSQRDAGYAVFGKVISGMEVADKISQLASHTVGPFQNVPQQPVLILSARLLSANKP